MNTIIEIVLRFLVGILVMLIHEMPKSITAYFVTHPVYRKQNPNKINPLKFIDPIGMIMFAFTSVGWQKPAEYNSARFRDKDKGILAVTFTGILSNLFFMTLCIPIFRSVDDVNIKKFILIFIYYNFSIVIINLLPVPPLEMSKIIYAVSHNAYFKLIQNERIIHTVFIFLLVVGILPTFINQLFSFSVYLLL